MLHHELTDVSLFYNRSYNKYIFFKRIGIHNTCSCFHHTLGDTGEKCSIIFRFSCLTMSHQGRVLDPVRLPLSVHFYTSCIFDHRVCNADSVIDEKLFSVYS